MCSLSEYIEVFFKISFHQSPISRLLFEYYQERLMVKKLYYPSDLLKILKYDFNHKLLSYRDTFFQYLYTGLIDRAWNFVTGSGFQNSDLT